MLRVTRGGGCQQRLSEQLRIFGSEAQRCGEYPRLMFSPQVVRTQAIVNELLSLATWAREIIQRFPDNVPTACPARS
jgi:hypothetical protein